MTPEQLEEIKLETERLVGQNLVDNPKPPTDYLQDADKINALLYNLGEMLLILENAYRRDVQMNIMGGDKNAVAESKAKAGNNYKRYRACELLYKRGEERIRLLKKTATIAQEEFNRT
jgi:hypothetical protein